MGWDACLLTHAVLTHLPTNSNRKGRERHARRGGKRENEKWKPIGKMTGGRKERYKVRETEGRE